MIEVQPKFAALANPLVGSSLSKLRCARDLTTQTSRSAPIRSSPLPCTAPPFQCWRHHAASKRRAAFASNQPARPTQHASPPYALRTTCPHPQFHAISCRVYASATIEDDRRIRIAFKRVEAEAISILGFDLTTFLPPAIQMIGIDTHDPTTTPPHHPATRHPPHPPCPLFPPPRLTSPTPLPRCPAPYAPLPGLDIPSAVRGDNGDPSQSAGYFSVTFCDGGSIALKV